YAGIDRFWRKQFLRYLFGQPGAFLEGVAAKTVAVVNAREVALTHNFREMARLSPVQRWLPGTGVLFPLALVGIVAWLYRKRGGEVARWWGGEGAGQRSVPPSPRPPVPPSPPHSLTPSPLLRPARRDAGVLLLVFGLLYLLSAALIFPV